jgi:hypothetical protein
VRWVLDRHPNLYVTSTTDGRHSRTSYHHAARAVDFGSDSPKNAPEARAQVSLFKKYGRRWSELLGPRNYPAVKDGQVYRQVEGAPLEEVHDTHLHIAL